jgi:hypothetical protein
MQTFRGKIRITNTQYLTTKGVEQIEYYLCMATCAQQDDRG